VFSILRIFSNFQGQLDYSERDTLTGLLNRKTFDESFLRAALSSGADPASPTVDARRRGAAADVAPDAQQLPLRDTPFRYGGEEFVVLMRCARLADAAAAFERLRATAERYAFPRVGHITVGIGFTEIRTGDTPTGCFERADKAVRHAKQSGRNRCATMPCWSRRGC
jgi:PleD family two-component response regulator